MAETSAVFHLDMFIPYPVVRDLVVEAFSPINSTDATSICSLVVVDVGANYECLNYLPMTGTVYPSDSGLTMERGVLDIGHVLNKGMFFICVCAFQ